MEYESVCCHGYRTTSHLVNLGWCHSPSFSVEVVDCGCGRWPCYASRDLGLPSLSRISGCSYSLACFHYPSNIHLVEFYQGWCWVQNNQPLEEGTVVCSPSSTSFWSILCQSQPVGIWSRIFVDNLFLCLFLDFAFLALSITSVYELSQ